jgi:hypothetical protein
MMVPGLFSSFLQEKRRQAASKSRKIPDVFMTKCFKKHPKLQFICGPINAFVLHGKVFF